MTRIARAAMISAVLTSVMSIADAVHHGLTGELLLDEDSSAGWVRVGSSLLLAATFGLLAAALAEQASRVDAGSRAIRWVRRLMQGVLAVLSIVFAGGLVVEAYAGTAVIHEAWGAVGGASFVLMFLISVVLGACLLRRPDLRVAAVLMAAPAAMIPLTFLVQVLAPGWAHPAYAETALYIGVALLGRSPTPQHRQDPRPNQPASLDRITA
jgi:hypothetical protein